MNKYSIGEWVIYTDIDGTEYSARIRSRRRGIYTLWFHDNPIPLVPMPTREGRGAGLMRGVPESQLEPV